MFYKGKSVSQDIKISFSEKANGTAYIRRQ